MRNLKSFSIAIGVLAAMTQPLFAGPPLQTDDPETPGPNNWEINVAFTAEKNHHDWAFEAPLLDINYGVGEQIQLKYEAPLAIVDAEGAGTRAGIGNSLVGVKWHFLEQEKVGLDVSTYPQFEFNTVHSSVRRGLTEDGTAWLLPIEVSHSFGSLTVYGEWGYALNEHNPDEHFYGIAAEQELCETFSVMGEFHGAADHSFGEHQLVANVGLHWRWTEEVSLICSAGRGLYASGSRPVDFLSYAGLQLTF